jgi:hypothetical protein
MHSGSKGIYDKVAIVPIDKENLKEKIYTGDPDLLF